MIYHIAEKFIFEITILQINYLLNKSKYLDMKYGFYVTYERFFKRFLRQPKILVIPKKTERRKNITFPQKIY